MLKITAIISLMLIGSAFSSCDSCGSECTSACGTRYFRSCCFNYLRKKRVPETFKFITPTQDMKVTQSKSKLPMFLVENVPVTEQWLAHKLSNEIHPYSTGDMTDNHLYDA